MIIGKNNESQIISVGIINYNGKDIIGDTINSLKTSDYPHIEIFVVDDGSSDTSVKYINNNFPDVEVFSMGENTNNLNKVRNKVLAKTNSRFVLITDNDIVFDKSCISNLYNTLITADNIAICTPRLFYHSNHKRIYTDGGLLHYVGSTIGINRNQIVDQNWSSSPRDNIGGGILLADRRKILEVGSFDEDLYMGWGDDGELYQRLVLSGLRCLHVPKAIAYHKAKVWNSKRHFRALAQVRNRWYIILTTYSRRTLLILFPMLMVFEIFQMILFVVKRIPIIYFKGTHAVFKELKTILKRRYIVQSKRKVSDIKMLSSGDLYITPILIDNVFLRFGIFQINMIFKLYWQFACRWL